MYPGGFVKRKYIVSLVIGKLGILITLFISNTTERSGPYHYQGQVVVVVVVCVCWGGGLRYTKQWKTNVDFCEKGPFKLVS